MLEKVNTFFYSKLFLAPLTLLMFGCATGLKETQSVIDKTTKAMVRNDKAQVWPNFNILDHSIIFISHNSHWVELFENKGRTQLAYTVWKEKIPDFPQSYSRRVIDRKNILVVNVDWANENTWKSLLDIIYHEGFHEFEQKGWNREKLSKGRGSYYPLQVIPRYFRWEALQSLEAYLKSHSKKDLQIYSYWYFKWKTNFKEEYDNFTDLIEGSAQFYANAMTANLAQTATSHKDHFYSTPLMKQNFSDKFDLSFESYILGTLSSIILDQLNVKNWKASVEKGTSPLELLAKTHKPKRAKTNNVAQGRFLKASLREMEKIDKDGKLDNLISHLANPKIVKVAIPTNKIKRSTFSTNGIYRSFFNYPGLTGVQFISLDEPHWVEGRGFKLKYNTHDYWITAQKTPCQKGHSTLLLLDPSRISLTKTTLTLNDRSFNQLSGETKKQNNVTWFCPSL